MTAVRGRMAQSMPRPRHVERHMDDLWAQTATAAVKAVAGCGRPAGNILEIEGMVPPRLDRTRVHETRDAPMDQWARDGVGTNGASAAKAATLLARYGTTAERMLAAEGADPQMLVGADCSNAGLPWLITPEQMLHLSDLVMRRTALSVTGQLSARDLDRIAGICGAT